MGRSVEFIRLYARRGFYQNHMYDAISGQRFNYPPLLFPAMSREEGSEERSESYLAS